MWNLSYICIAMDSIAIIMAIIAIILARRADLACDRVEEALISADSELDIEIASAFFAIKLASEDIDKALSEIDILRSSREEASI